MKTLEALRFDPRFMQNVAAWERLPARAAHYAPFPTPLSETARAALSARGIEQLYTHQAEAIEAALRGEHVVIVTGTASGKTLCYNAPVLHTLLADPEARALYLFPTKALAQDQADELSQLVSVLPAPPAIRLYDGDTPSAQRSTIRKAARVLLSNPDMLHTGILPHHPKWADFFANLRYVVLDELHVYRGVFGSHLTNVIRRLARICRFYGAAPQFICASATIANPRELAEKLLEAPITLVNRDGSPRAEKVFILYNPPLLDATLGLRRSYLLETQTIANRFLADGAQTVVFARTRNATEILLGYIRDDTQARAGDTSAIRGYRGGYLPLERREIERGLREGVVRGVVATNALELGVDIGQLEAAIMAGYPGTIASLWQQAGRAGRRSGASAAVLVASAAPLDQYLATHPRYLFETSPEHARLNPDNLALLINHLRCAAFELPFKRGETFGTFAATDDLLQVLLENGELHRSRDTYRWVSQAYPADAISLRSAGNDSIVIQVTGEERPLVIGEVDRATAPRRVHEGAVYLHEGRQFVVTHLDWESGRADVSPTEVDYFTEASETVDLQVVNVLEARETKMPRAWGELLITSQPASYRRVKRYTHEIIGYGEVNLPAHEFQTTGYWLWIPPALTRSLALEGVLLAPNDYGPNWPQQRTAARQRDGYQCRQCGALEAGREHDVHHVTPFRSFGYVPGENEHYLRANELSNLLTLCRTCHSRTEMGRGTQTALGGLAHALSNIAPFFLMCDPRDLGVVSEARAAATGAPTITLYDLVPDGLGFAEQLFALHAELLQGTLELVRACPCREGCPACVGPVGVEGLEVKTLTLKLAEALVKVEAT